MEVVLIMVEGPSSAHEQTTKPSSTIEIIQGVLGSLEPDGVDPIIIQVDEEEDEEITTRVANEV